MATFLLVVIYIAFIGLGLPDALFGAAWPVIYTEFGLPVSWATFVTVLTAGGTIISSLVSARVINKFGTAAVAAVSTGMTAAALLGFSLSGSFIWMILFSIPMGLGAGSIDVALNNYVALHYNATQMSFLHCFYGVGTSVSPYLMSMALSSGNWRSGYRMVFFIQLIITLLLVFSMPLWKKAGGAESGEESEGGITVGFVKLIKQPKVRMAGIVFIGTCALESCCGLWGSTYFVLNKGLAEDTAARMVASYYIGMAIGRFLSGILANKLSSRKIIGIGQVVIGVAIVLMILPLPAVISSVGLFLIGIGEGPVYPNMIHLVPELFGKRYSQSVIGALMGLSYVGILLAPVLFGYIAQYVSIALYPYYLLLALAVLALGYFRLDRSAFSIRDEGAGERR